MSMRLSTVGALALIPTLALGDASVRRPGGTPTRAALCVQLLTAPAVPSARELEWQASVRPSSGRVAVRASLLRVVDAAGHVVFSDGRAFFGGDRGPPWNIALGMSTNAGPSLPELPRGDYAAIWTVDGVESAPARFTVGPKPPPPLSLEWNGCGCGAPLTAHLYNAGARNLDLLAAYETSALIVDGKRFTRQMTEWDGGTTLPPRRSWNVGLAPAEYGATLTPGDHVVELELAGQRASVPHATSCAAPASAPAPELTVELSLEAGRYRITHRYAGRERLRFVTGATDRNCDEPVDELIVDGEAGRLGSELPCGGQAFRAARVVRPGESWTIEGTFAPADGRHTVIARYCPTADDVKAVSPDLKGTREPRWWLGCVESAPVDVAFKR
jgi:hypothetical protein